MNNENVEALLAHFGVKGMKWGVRKERTPSQRLKQIEKRLMRFDAERVFNGAGLVGHYQQKRPSNSPFVKTQLRLGLRTAVESVAFMGGTRLLMSQVSASPETKRGGQLAFDLLGVQGIGLARLSQMRDVNTYRRHRNLIAEQREILKTRGSRG